MTSYRLFPEKDKKSRLFVVNVKRNSFWVKGESIDKLYQYDTWEALLEALSRVHKWPDVVFFDHR